MTKIVEKALEAYWREIPSPYEISVADDAAAVRHITAYFSALPPAGDVEEIVGRLKGYADFEPTAMMPSSEQGSTYAKIMIETLLHVHALTNMHRASDDDEYRKKAAAWLPDLERQLQWLKRELVPALANTEPQG